MAEIEKPVAEENPDFKCRACKSGNLWYTKGETSDGAYDTFDYHCHDCGQKWRVVDETD